ncbi:MAG: NosD domain-containing protein [Candidatus Thorarchaeota archaeon]|nr:NosD domain-containing protein [Candidatus Thorarchaeota archaeon]
MGTAAGGTSKIMIAVIMVVIISAAGFLYVLSNPTILSNFVIPTDEVDDSRIQGIDSPLKIVGDEEMREVAEEFGFLGTGSRADPYVIENLSIVSEGNCIDIRNVEASFEIRGCSVAIYNWQYSAICIYISNCQDACIVNCRTEGGISGIEVFQSDGCRVLDCTAKYSIFGLNFSLSDFPKVSNCIIDNNTEGIVLVGSHNANLTKNGIFRNVNGIRSQWTNGSFMTSNNITSNTQGVLLEQGCNNWTITSNWITFNDDYGIHLDSGVSFTCMYANMFGWNIVNNAKDDGLDNKWDESELEEGNFWHDYTGTGWYAIPGVAESIDHYPQLLE